MSEDQFMVFDDTNNEISVDDVRLAEVSSEVIAAMDAAMYPNNSSDKAA